MLERRLAELADVRRQVLENADVREGDVVLDVGAGNGLIGFGALELVGAGGRDDDERAEFEAYLREELERTTLIPARFATVYLRAVKR